MDITSTFWLIIIYLYNIVHMKCSELLRKLKRAGWMEISRRGSHVKLIHPERPGTIIFPDHGSNELGKGLQLKIMRDAGLIP
jgi:predicted RNA binding protein YcfA (HicA-like mRNA interferase family)